MVETIILNYQGKAHLESLLPSLFEECTRFGHKHCCTTILDNSGPDFSLDFAGDLYPGVKIVKSPCNDFLFSYNWYAAQTESKILIFLNNDLKILPNFISNLCRNFSKDDIFAVSATSLDWDGREPTWGPIRLQSHHGHYYWNPNYSRQTRAFTLFASGGFMAVDREKFLRLGGFNELYHPAYCEDLDLCFRAWRSGWKTIFEPESVVLHREHGSWGAAGNDRTQRLMQRSKWLFEWSSLPSRELSPIQSAFLLKKSLGAIMRGDLWWFSGYFEAVAAWNSRKHLTGYPRATALELEKVDRSIAMPIT